MTIISDRGVNFKLLLITDFIDSDIRTQPHLRKGSLERTKAITLYFRVYGRLLLVDSNWPLFDVPMSIGIELTMLWNIFEVPTLCPKKQESMY